MPLFACSVIVPFRMEARDQAPIHSLHVDTVASTQQAAATTAKVLTTVHATIKHGRKPSHIFMERAVVGRPSHGVAGPYMYLFTRGDRIPNLSFPRRIGDQVGTELNESLAGIQQVYGCVMDGAQMSYINTNGLTALIQHYQHCNLHLCRLPAPIEKVMSIVGIDRRIPIHPDLHGALDHLVQSCRSKAADRMSDGGFAPRS